MSVLELVGACVGSGALTLLLTPLVNRRINKLSEAEIIARVSIQLREELLEEYQEQKETIGTLRRVIINLTGLLDEVFPRIEGITEDERRRLREGNLEARLAGLAARA